MKKEDKELLMRDLCAWLPYGVKCQAHNGTLICVNANNGIAVVQTDRGVRQVLIENLKPYLRPVSSMTEKEKKEFDNFCVIDEEAWMKKSITGFINQSIIMSNGIDWLNAHHFDYRGLIEKGLALPAPEGMYNEIKEE